MTTLPETNPYLGTLAARNTTAPYFFLHTDSIHAIRLIRFDSIRFISY